MLRVFFSYGFSCVSRMMNMSNTPTKRVEENEMDEEIPIQVDQVLQVVKGS